MRNIPILNHAQKRERETAGITARRETHAATWPRSVRQSTGNVARRGSRARQTIGIAARRKMHVRQTNCFFGNGFGNRCRT